MVDNSVLLLAWGMLTVFLLAGLVLHERTGLRLGGVLVLPLLLLYAVFDIAALAVFAVAAAVAFVGGELIYHRSFLYGRRLLYVFLIIGIGATILARQYIELAMGGFILALLPGLFAYNMHREGRYAASASAFMTWLGILLVASVTFLWFISQPEALLARMAPARDTAATWAGTVVDRFQALFASMPPVSDAMAYVFAPAWDQVASWSAASSTEAAAFGFDPKVDLPALVAAILAFLEFLRDSGGVAE